MRKSGSAPRRNVALRKLRRDFGNRRWDRGLWVLWGGFFWGVIAFFVGDHEDWWRQRRAQRALRRKHHEEVLEAGQASEEGEEERAMFRDASPTPLDRRERDDLHRAIRRRRLLKTSLLVFSLMVLYYAVGLLRTRWLGR